MAEYFDTHCHIHTAGSGRDDFTVKKWHEAGENDPADLLNSAVEAGVTRLICVGTDSEDSIEAVKFVQNHKNAWAAVGSHPHEAKKTQSDDLQKIRELVDEDQKQASPTRKVVAVGEVGLDYYYEHSPKDSQIKLLEEFLQLAHDYQLPVIFHVRDALADFWPIFDNFSGLKGVMHSFTAGSKTLKKALERDLFIGLNGILTFTKDEAQLEMAKQVPRDKLLLETDSPYLSPSGFREKICRPQYVIETAKFLAQLRGESAKTMSEITTQNACHLFNLP